MAVSNSIGSNVFDILIGLAVPWLIKTTMYHPGSTVRHFHHYNKNPDIKPTVFESGCFGCYQIGSTQ